MEVLVVVFIISFIYNERESKMFNISDITVTNNLFAKSCQFPKFFSEKTVRLVFIFTKA